MKQNDIIAPVESLYAKLPPLPANVREFIVAVVPWLAVIFGVLGVLASLSAFGVSAVFSPLVALGGGIGLATGILIATLLGLVESVMLLVATPSLLKKKRFGWILLFWAEVIAVVAAVVSLSIVSVIVALIGLYFLFQIKSYYK